MAGVPGTARTTTSFERVLVELGVEDATLSANEVQRLDEEGYAIFTDVLDRSTVDELREQLEAIEIEEDAWDGGTSERDPGAVRIDDVNHRGDIFDVVWTHPKLLAAMAHYLGDFRLSSVTARAARPHAGHQPLHVDWWGPIEERCLACNSSWLLTDFTRSNGATRVVPGSHRWGRSPDEDMDDPRAAHPAEEYLEAPAGSLVVFHGYLWHSGTENTTELTRRAIFSVFSQRERPRQNDQRALLDEVGAARLSAAARYLLDA
jgi:ectoine hydroxylase-related dioxygenase (phytanoyl-CoA dioxygenase family)